MAPFRASRSTRSNRAGLTADADIVCDGLPIRQWRMQESVFGAPVAIDSLDNVDLPEFALSGDASTGMIVQGHDTSGANDYPMPKGSNTYAPWCQHLLRATRSGRIIRRPEGSWTSGGAITAAIGRHASEDKENTNQDAEEGATTSAPNENKINNDKGFIMTRWTPIPRHQEEEEAQYLAKRRKGLARMNIAIDAIGINGYNQSQIVSVDPGPEDPARKRNPPPRRKPKRGPGRGKKKITDTPGGGVSASVEELARLEGEDNVARAPDANGSQDAQMDGADDYDDDDDDMEDYDGEEGDDREDRHVSGDKKANGDNLKEVETPNGVETVTPAADMPNENDKQLSTSPPPNIIIRSPPVDHAGSLEGQEFDAASLEESREPQANDSKAEEEDKRTIPTSGYLNGIDSPADASLNDVETYADDRHDANT